MKMMRIMVKRAISIFGVVELLILGVYFSSFEIFINLQIAFLSSFFVIIGSSFAYKQVVNSQLKSKNYEEKKDLLDEIEDPYELYEETTINNAPVEELDLKEIVKEEKSKIKTFNLSSMKQGAKGSLSLFRMIPYLFLVLGFIALENNHLLSITVYIPSIFLGIVVGSISSKAFSS